MKYLLLSFIIISLSYGATNPQKIINQTQKDFIQKQIYKEQESNEILKDINFHSVKLLDINNTSKDKNNCIKIDKINILDMTIFSENIFKQIIDKYLHKCNTIEELTNLTNNITNIYIQKGYITSKAYIKPQDLSNGTLNINVLEGRIDNVVSDEINMLNLYNGYKGRVFNLRDLEVALQQADRLESQKLSLNLLPSKKLGYTMIKVSNSSDKKRFYGNIGLNNYGTKKTGKYQIYNNFNYENLLSLNDILSINLNFTNKVFKSNDKTFGTSINYSIPYERFLFDIFYDYSNYKQINGDEFGTSFKSDGNNNSKGMNIAYKAYHSLHSSFEFILKYNHKKSKNHLNDVKLDLQSYSSSSLGIGFKHSYRGLRFDYYSKFLIHEGIGGDKDGLALPNLYYEKYIIDLGFNKYFNTSNHLKYNLYLRAQYSDDELFGNDEVSIGGIYSVRGFKNSGLSGSSGFYTRNELSMQYNILNTIFMPYLGVDYGYVKKDKNAISGSIVGSSIGSRVYWDKLNLELFYNIPLKNTDYTKDESSNFFGFNLTYNY